MDFRTDLAVEAAEVIKDFSGLESREETVGESHVSRITVKSEQASKKIGKPLGRYVTVTVPPLTDYFQSTDERITVISKEIKSLLPKEGLILVAGLGNLDVTPDALGPKTIDKVLATRHISGELAKSIGLEDLRPVCALTPGVLGDTGIEAAELLSSVTEKLKPSCVIVIDALASRRTSRLGRTVQISDGGIAPGSGVGNSRAVISRETLGTPVISIGVPTVVDAATLAADLISQSRGSETEEIQNDVSPRGEAMIVTPREIDLLIDRASTLVGMAVNCALHPDFSPDDLYSLVS